MRLSGQRSASSPSAAMLRVCKEITRRKDGQSVAPSRPIAGVVANTQRGVRRKVAAGAGALCIDAAAYRPANFTVQRNAARRRFVGAAHAQQRGCQRHGQFDRHTVAWRCRQIGTVKIDAKSGAASAAGKTGQDILPLDFGGQIDSLNRPILAVILLLGDGRRHKITTASVDC